MFSRFCILRMAFLLLLPISARTAERPFPYGRIDSAKINAITLHDKSADTLETRVTEQNQRLYDSIASKTRRRAVPRMLYRLLFVRNRADTTGTLYEIGRAHV